MEHIISAIGESIMYFLPIALLIRILFELADIKAMLKTKDAKED